MSSDWIAPPVALCSRCGHTECIGCWSASAAHLGTIDVIAWEQPRRRLFERLWATAWEASNAPIETFAQLSRGSLSASLRFALLTESAAAGSVCLFLMLPLFVVAPRWTVSWLTTAYGATVIGIAWGGLTALVIALHALWGLSLEIYSSDTDAALSDRLRSGLRFGMYACSWDLLTSPLGLLLAVLACGWRRGWATVRSAAAAPRPAVTAYLEGSRNLSPEARQRAVRRGFAALSTTLAAALVATLFASCMGMFG